MKCPQCQNAIVIGFSECVVCQKNNASTELLPFRYFVLVPTIFWIGLHLLEPIQDLDEAFKGLWISTLGGVVWGSIFWLFYAIFRRGQVH